VVVAGGQSGHPFDPHYDDQIPVFLAGALRSLYWSAEAIAEHTVSTLRLEP
jgi:acyl-homoserine lactone acylase PvdQ